MDNNNAINRRNFIANAAKAGIAAGLSLTVLPSLAGTHPQDAVTFTQQPLPYAYKDLEPVIDALTMEIHYTKHAATYTKNLNEAVAAETKGNQSLEKLLANVSKYSSKLRNNAGGHYNHELFWQLMTPKSSGKPSGKLSDAIVKDFGSFEAFKAEFTAAGKDRFGSGWAWLVLTDDNKLKVGSTPNQDNPLMDVSTLKGKPLLGLDVWEHAYYLKYQNKRPDYINNWWNIVNWDVVEKRFV